MLASLLPTRSARLRSLTSARRFQPRLETLERRDCPAIGITQFTAMPQAGQMVLLSGHVQDDQSANITVKFSGAVTDSVSTDTQGNFSDLVAQPAPPTGGQSTSNAVSVKPVSVQAVDGGQAGNVQAVANDDQAQVSAAVQAFVAQAIAIANLNATPLPGGLVCVSGNVTGISASDSVNVVLTGAVSGSAPVAADGTFSVTLAGDNGTISAVATATTAKSVVDAISQVGTADVDVSAPQLTSCTQAYCNGYMWTLTGKVNGGWPGAKQVVFNGIPAGEPCTATTDASGNFTLTFNLQQAQGQVLAEAFDAIGQDSNTYVYILVGN